MNANPAMTGQYIDRGASAEEIQYHLAGHFARVGTDTFRSHTMRPSVNADPFLAELGFEGSLQNRQAHRYGFQNAKRTGRFSLPVYFVDCRRGNIYLHFCDEVFRD